MTLIEAFFLGLLQGLTEFLPISSSGHLAMFQSFFGITEPTIVFDIIVHLATLMAVVIFFWPQIKVVTKSQLKLIIVATIPTGIIGLILEPVIENLFSSFLLTIIGFFVSGLILLSLKLPQLTSIKSRTVNPVSAFLIGIFQGLAIIPSISRSGATVVSSLWLGINKTEAFNFSFLISIPAILAATVLEVKDTTVDSWLDPNLIIGFVTAAISGFLSLIVFKYVVKTSKLHYFGYYCILLSLILAILAVNR